MFKSLSFSIGLTVLSLSNMASANGCGNTIPGSYSGVDAQGESCTLVVAEGRRGGGIGGNPGSICRAAADFDGERFSLMASIARADGVFRTQNFYNGLSGGVETVIDDEAGELRQEKDVLIFDQGNLVVDRVILADVYTFTPAGRRILVERNRELYRKSCFLN